MTEGTCIEIEPDDSGDRIEITRARDSRLVIGAVPIPGIKPPDLSEFERTVDIVQSAQDEGVDVSRVLTSGDIDFLGDILENELTQGQLDKLEGIQRRVNRAREER